jgi:hypothetical protein
LSNFSSRIAKNCNDPAGISVRVHECAPFNTVGTFPADGEVSVGFLELDWFWVPIPGESGSKLICGVQHPGIPGCGRKECQRAYGDKASVVFSRPVLNVFYLLGEEKVLALDPLFPWSALDLFAVHVVVQPR